VDDKKAENLVQYCNRNTQHTLWQQNDKANFEIVVVLSVVGNHRSSRQHTFNFTGLQTQVSMGNNASIGVNLDSAGK
jgi:hypothetical protein